MSKTYTIRVSQRMPEWTVIKTKKGNRKRIQVNIKTVETRTSKEKKILTKEEILNKKQSKVYESPYGKYEFSKPYIYAERKKHEKFVWTERAEQTKKELRSISTAVYNSTHETWKDENGHKHTRYVKPVFRLIPNHKVVTGERAILMQKHKEVKKAQKRKETIARLSEKGLDTSKLLINPINNPLKIAA